MHGFGRRPNERAVKVNLVSQVLASVGPTNDAGQQTFLKKKSNRDDRENEPRCKISLAYIAPLHQPIDLKSGKKNVRSFQ